jgi:hypothetical protein
MKGIGIIQLKKLIFYSNGVNVFLWGSDLIKPPPSFVNYKSKKFIITKITKWFSFRYNDRDKHKFSYHYWKLIKVEEMLRKMRESIIWKFKIFHMKSPPPVGFMNRFYKKKFLKSFF